MHDNDPTSFVPGVSSYVTSRKLRMQYNKQQLSLSPAPITQPKEININKSNVPTLELPFIPLKSEGEKTLLSTYTNFSNAKKKLKPDQIRNMSMTVQSGSVLKMATDIHKPSENHDTDAYLAKLKEVESIKKIANFKILKFSNPFTNYIEIIRESLKAITDPQCKIIAEIAILDIEKKWLKYLNQYNAQAKASEQTSLPTKEESKLALEVQELKAQLEQMSSRGREKSESNATLKKLDYYRKVYDELKAVSTKEVKDLRIVIDNLREQNKVNKDKLAAYANQSIVSELRKKLESSEYEFLKYKEVTENELKTMDSTVYRLQIEKCALKEEEKNKSNMLAISLQKIDQLTTDLNKCNKLCNESQLLISAYENSMDMMSKLITQMRKLKCINFIKRKSQRPLKCNKKLLKNSIKKLLIWLINYQETSLNQAKEGQVQKVEVPLDGELFEFYLDSYGTMINNIKRSVCKDLTKASKVLTEIDELHESITKNDKGETVIDSIQLQKYTYCRPNFIAFIDHMIPKEMNAHLVFNPPYPDWLHCTLRGIMDSKWNECLYSERDGRRISKFSDFVYSWLGNYMVDDKKRCVREMEWIEKDSADNYRLQLLLGLQSHRSSSNWEAFNFREFLEEKFTEDELFFFLHCRYLLFKGSQLSTTSGMYYAKHYVSYERVSELVDTVMLKASEKERSNLKEKLKISMKCNANNSLDSSMILRILLEYYIREKKVKIAILQILYNDQPKISSGLKISLSFRSFKIVFEQFDRTLSQIEIAELYRDSWASGGGNASFEAIVLTLNESYYFNKKIFLQKFEFGRIIKGSLSE